MEQTAERSVFDDLATLEPTLTEDLAGERTRGMLKYFEDAVATTEAGLASLGGAERQLATQMIEGFRASQRIVRQAWETIHQSALMV
jgi:hypothetical protein